jgi:phosphatidylinositol alpha 1,6-mannosyltransferase
MRIAIIAESFSPDVNGVANSVVRVAEHLINRGHQPLVIAPQPSSATPAVTPPLPYPVVRVPSLPMPGYAALRVGLPSRRIAAALREHGTDVVHLAAPVILGRRGVSAAIALDLPSVAVYQTDIAAFARLYHLGFAESAAWRWLRRVHNSAGRTLAPSTATATTLLSHGIERVWLWRRGVDTVRFNPVHRSAALRRALAPGGEVIVGYVGRLAVEKQVELLAETTRLPGVRVVVVGTGPVEASVRKALPGALFLGERHGPQLSRVYASLDVFAHTGPYETFGQAVQEALASGVPVVAPAAGGPLDLVLPGRTGYLVEPYSGSAIAAAVAELVAHPQTREAYAREARASVVDRTWAAVGDELIGHYVAVHSGEFFVQPQGIAERTETAT